MKFALVASVMLAAASSSATAQTVLSDSRGFEAPFYSQGLLDGQNGWRSDSTVPSFVAAGVVQSAVVASGGQAVQLRGGVGNNWFFPPINYTPTAGQIISVRADIARTLGGSTASNSFGYMLDLYGTNGARLASAGLINFNGTIRALATTLDDTGGLAALLATPTVYNQRQFVSFEMLLNFSTRTFDLRIDGALALRNLRMYSSTATGLADADLQVQSDIRGTDSGYFDNYIVSVIPTPASVAVLGLGGLSVLRRRRR